MGYPPVVPVPAAQPPASQIHALLSSVQGTPEQKQQIIQQVLALKPEHLEAIPDPVQRQQLQQLQATLVRVRRCVFVCVCVCVRACVFSLCVGGRRTDGRAMVQIQQLQAQQLQAGYPR